MVDFLFIGDSLTFGYGVSKKDSFVYKIQNFKSEFSILNKGVNGDTSTGILSRFYKDVTLNKPKNVFIMCGTNDLLSGRNVDSIISNIEIMIKDSLSINSKVFIGIPPDIIKDLAFELFTPSNYYKNTEKFLPILREKLLSLKEKYPVTLIDFYSLTNKNKCNNIYLDGIHLNPKGQNLLFTEVCKIIF